MFETPTDSPSSMPINIIYTGVAGTGKTYQLLQIAKQYTSYLPAIDGKELLAQLLFELSWREVVCLVLLDLRDKEQELVKVPEIIAHDFFVAKARQNERDKNLSNTAWSVLQMHSSITSQTVTYKQRASQAYFDKDESGAWHLLPESLALLTVLTQSLAEYQQALNQKRQSNQQQRYSLVSFHQAYGYEEFVEGIRPVLHSANPTRHGQHNQQGSQMHYDIQDGAFLKLCQRAKNDPEHRYAMLIDEINRANVSRVFGELLSLIEADKRLGQINAMQVNLAYSGRVFGVPSNVDIYATMNTQDHSLAPLDMALRRRFRFMDCQPQPQLLAKIDVANNANISEDSASLATIDLAKLLIGLNRRIIETLGIEAQLGHAFLLSVRNLSQLQLALIEQIIPQLAQTAGGQLAILQYIFNDEQQPINTQFIQALQSQQNEDRKQNLPFNSQPDFLGQGMAFSGYLINRDLMEQTGEFANPENYQRLY